MSIRRLPLELVNRIAAGEVVERPASALKELVENALDAGSATIRIRLVAGGLELIEVADDGSGMTPDEMRLALERHATSKLPDDGLERILSFGFRGEALPSIASVSHLMLDSRVRGSDGWRVEIDHGAPVGEGPAALPPGTCIRVERLFEKVPARRKFLRSPRGEYAACLDTVKRLAMARSDVAFVLEHDGRRILSLQPTTPPQRIAELLSAELDRNGIGIDCERNGMGLTGVVSLPTFNRGMADQQFLFVNARPVKDRLLVGALRGAYRDLIARDRHPIAALFLSVPLEEVDVNVHPAKTEVRFRDPTAVRGLIVGGLRAALDEASQKSATREQAAAPVLWTTSATYDEQLNRLSTPVSPVPQWAPAGSTAVLEETKALFDHAPAARAEPAVAEVPKYPLGVARGQVAATYIVAEAEDGLVIVDQHAAHERLVLERMRAAREGGTIARQPLLMPEVVDLEETDCDRRSWQGRCPWSSRRSGSRTRGVRWCLFPPGEARPCLRDHRLPRIGEGRAGPFCRRDERAPARDGDHAQVRAVQPRASDLGEAGPRRDGEAVRKALKFALFGRHPSLAMLGFSHGRETDHGSVQHRDRRSCLFRAARCRRA
jgi:DNA mismatch repair protein MutL